MSERIDRFCENLRLKLTNIENGLKSLKAKVDGKAKDAEQEVRGHLDKVEKRIESDRAKLSAAQSETKEWVEDRKTATATRSPNGKPNMRQASCRAAPIGPKSMRWLPSRLPWRQLTRPSEPHWKRGWRGRTRPPLK